MEIIYKKPVLSDIVSMNELVKEEVDNGIILNRSIDEMATTIRSYTIAVLNGEIVGFVALHIHNVTLAEVRSLIVRSDLRGHHIGIGLVEQTLVEAKNLGVKDVLVLTYRADFFKKFGFVEIPKESIPESKIWADCIKCKHFPICDEVSLITHLQ